MGFSFAANRHIWYVMGFALLLLLAAPYSLTETSLSAHFNLTIPPAIQLFLPLIANGPDLCGTIPCTLAIQIHLPLIANLPMCGTIPCLCGTIPC